MRQLAIVAAVLVACLLGMRFFLPQKVEEKTPEQLAAEQNMAAAADQVEAVVPEEAPGPQFGEDATADQQDEALKAAAAEEAAARALARKTQYAEALSKEGFSLPEIEEINAAVAEAYNNPEGGVVQLAPALEEVSARLGLDQAKKDKLQAAVEIAESGANAGAKTGEM